MIYHVDATILYVKTDLEIVNAQMATCRNSSMTSAVDRTVTLFPSKSWIKPSFLGQTGCKTRFRVRQRTQFFIVCDGIDENLRGLVSGIAFVLLLIMGHQNAKMGIPNLHFQFSMAGGHVSINHIGDKPRQPSYANNVLLGSPGTSRT